MDTQELILLISPKREISESINLEPFPTSFFSNSSTTLDWSEEVGQRRRFQTDSFADFSHKKDDSFMVSEDLFFKPESRRKLSCSGLSYPKNNLNNAFGTTMFSSNWMTETSNSMVSNADDTDNDDIESVAKTIEHLGLGDPMLATQLNSFEPPMRTRPRSLSFPHDFNMEHSRMIFERSNRSTTECVCNSSEDEHNYDIYDTNEKIITPKKDDVDNNNHESIGPSRSLWLGNLDSSVSIEELSSIFSKFGVIESVRVLPEKECAFVNYCRVEDAILGRERMQGGRIGNCVVRIGFGKPESSHDTQGMSPTKSLWIGNLSDSTKPYDLEICFGKFGPVESARILTHKNCGFVNFLSLDHAIIARNELNGKEINGSVVKIGFAKVPSKVDPPLTLQETLANPTIMAGLVAGALNRLNAANFTEQPTRQDILQLPELPQKSIRKEQQILLRDYRKMLDGNGMHNDQRDIDRCFFDLYDDAVEMCSGKYY